MISATSNRFLISFLGVIFYLLRQVYGEGMLYPTRPVRYAVLDQNSVSLLTLYFRVSTQLAANNYLRIQLPDYGQGNYIFQPTNCLLKYSGDTVFTTSQCGIMPNVSDTMYVLLSKPVDNSQTTENILQIELNTTNPLTGISSSLRVSTISSIQSTVFFQYDENANFGQIPFTQPNNEVFQATVLNYGTPSTVNIPGLPNNLQIQIQINKPFGLDQKMSRIKLIASSPWVFDPATTVTCQDDSRYAQVSDARQALYKAPQLVLKPTDPSLPVPLVKTEVETPNQLSIVFAQGFLEGSAFVLNINSLVNPSITAQGVLKIYSFPVNSNESVEANASLLQLQTFQTPIQVTLLPSLPFDPNNPTNTPINFYKNTKQYVKIQININQQTIPAGYPILLQFTPNTNIIQGSEYLDSNMQDINGNYIRNVKYLSNNQMLIYNLKQMKGTPANPTITIQVRVLLSKTDSQFNVSVSIYTDLTLSSPVFSGVSNTVALITNYKSVIQYLQDQTYAQNGFVQIKTAPNDITFNIQVPNNDLTPNLKLQLYISSSLTQETTPIACTINGGTTFTCSYNSMTNYVRIDMVPGSFTNAATTIVIKNIKFNTASNHEDSIYELFFRITKDSTNANSSFNDLMLPLIVIQQANSNIKGQFINDLNQQAANPVDYSFPSFLDIYDTADTFSTFTPPLQPTERYFLAVYVQQDYLNIAQMPPIGSQYYCGSTLPGVSCYYKYSDKTTTPQSSVLFKQWAKIVFFLPTSTKVGYHMAIPYLFNQNNYNFQIEGGYFNTATYVFKVLFTNTLTSFAPSTILATVTNLCPTTAITLSGNAGAQISGVQMQLARSNVYTQGVGSAAILVTDWQFWYANQSKYTTPLNAITGTGVLDPVSVSYIDLTGISRFAVIFPFTATGDPTIASTTVSIDSVVLPYSYDLPNLLFIIAQGAGKLNCYKQYFNSGRNLFYISTPKSLQLTCDQQSNGIQNTQCTVQFVPAQNMQPFAILQIQFTGMQANTNQCTLIQKNILTNTQVQITQSCSVSTNSQILTVNMQDNVIYSNDMTTYTYQLSFYGVSIDNSLQKSFTFSIKDQSGNTAIEQQTINVSTTNYQAIYIQVSQLIYKYLNPYVFSKLTAQFATPRQLLPNENVVVNLGSDLWDVNSNTDRLTVTLFKIDTSNPSAPQNIAVPIAVQFAENVMGIQLADRTQFTASSYILVIDGILTPASNSNDLISISFIRNYDSGLVLQNIQSTTVPFPSLLQKINSQIILAQANFLMEGSLQELVFNVTMKNSQITSSAIMYIYFPIYYAPSISNFPAYLYCRMNNIQIPCKYNNNPFRLEISESPLFIQPGQQFTLLVFGPVAPQYDLRNNPQYVNETIFFAVDTGATNSFSEYIHIPPPQVVQIPSNFPYMRLITVTTDNTNTRALSNHVFVVETDTQLPNQNGFQVIFPTDYKYLAITSQLQCMISYFDSNNIQVDTPYQTCNVTGLSVEGIMPITIAASARFIITIQQVPTPPTGGFVDLSRAIIAVFSSSRQNYIAQTNYLTNQMGSIQFIEQTNFVQINAGQVIQVTKGTYSPNIIIQTANQNKFIANMIITLSATGFTFIPPSMNIYLGDLQTSFRVGADQNMLEKQYTASISKVEFGFTPVYQIANNLIIFVISQPIQIVTPTSINVPYGGCSLPYQVQISSTPYSDVDISIQYDYTTLPEGYLTVDIDLSSYTLYFDSKTNYRYLTLCSTPQFPKTLTTFPVTLTLGGTDMQSFLLVNPNLTVNMITRDPTIIPSLITTVLNQYRTSTDFSVSFNQDGTVYWQLYVQGTAQNLSLSQIKAALKAQNTTLQSPTSLQQQFFGKKTDQRVGLQVFHTSDTSKQFTISSLIPETNYVLCTYFENEMSKATDIKCLNFKTLNWQVFTKVNISFLIKMFEDDMNNILCFYVRNTQTSIKNIINSDGNSCSLQSVTQPYYFQFKGKTASYSNQMTNIYLIPDATLETDSSITTIAAMYDAATKQLLDDVRTNAKQNYNINEINQSQFLTTFSYDDAINKQSNFIMPSITNMQFKPVSYQFNTTIEIQDVILSNDGQVYFIAERVAKELFDNQKGKYYDAPITSMNDPTPENIINCQNGLGYTADVCARIIYNNNNKVTLILDNLVPETKYVIYYVVANHFPITPIYDTVVQKTEIISLPYGAGNHSTLIQSTFAIIVLLIIIF
ncbi:transmembrane protein, putative (macronuclear) [Tetrahymena thermophila SB210]|uniref:Transmembrane protein, putative n=1 Tax=Tetrahymena thermophila (strain SB210) TaxID=312017 RepID=Q23BZ4_TETTS|nr:transmembrane protein, putative [Tetrahymena thermophila SB210]EAR93974.2 transmembrane protein, putative [Tetrahymena thermophila SB210]|eukprot:XP_001014219.2 transmembrane protein, putative [Tetrahymena thermophila SB210]